MQPDSIRELILLGVEKVLFLPVTTAELISEINDRIYIFDGNTCKNSDFESEAEEDKNKIIL